LASVTAPEAIVTALPLLVTSPLRLGMVVTVAALPVTDPAIGAVTVRPPSVPTLVSEEAVTPEFRVAPVSVPAAAVTVMFPVPLNEVPLIVLAVCKAVAVAAFPDVDPDAPVTLPVIGAVTVSEPRVPTDVSDDAVTPDANVEPVSVPAAAGIADPSSSRTPPDIDSLLVWLEIENEPFV
tara:strand:- start:22 stop:561 length:540 start_codon:yes stop_codon:yes gene_type:complete